MLKTSIHIPLPSLPRQIRSQEADFGVEFRRWWEQNPLSGNFELKHTKGAHSLPFAAVESDQLVVGRAALSTKGTLLRVTVGTPGAPDYVGQIAQPTYIVIRYPAAFYLIPLKIFLSEKEWSSRKSLTSKRASEIAAISVPC